MLGSIILLLGACEPASPPRPSVLLVTSDTTRFDYVDPSGGHTPSWAGVAAGGLWFTRAFSPTPITLPSHTSLLTGTEPPYHGVHNNGTYRVPERLETLAERLRAAGWSTGAAVASFPVSAQFGLDQGFDRYDQSGLARPGQAELFAERDAAAVTDAALALAASLEEPWFIWVHYYDPHAPYDAPEPYASRYEDPYRAEIAYADAQLGRLLAGLGERPLLTVLTADHGESLGEHGEADHGMFVHDATTHIPLVMSWPGVLPAGRSLDYPARLADVAPTILDLLGLPPLPPPSGRSLRPGWEGGDSSGEAAEELPIYGESYMPRDALGMAPITALRLGDLRLVRTTRERLFELRSDPGERTDRAAERPEDVRRLSAALDAYLSTHAGDLAAAGELDEASREQLEALGYIWSAAGASAPGGEGDLYEHPELLALTSAMSFEGREPEDIVAVLRAHPRALRLWSLGLERLQRMAWEGYGELLAEAAAGFPEDHGLQALLLLQRVNQGQVEQAAEQLAELLPAVLADDTPEPATLNLICWSAHLLGDEQALAAALPRYAATPLFATHLLVDRGQLLHQLGALEPAVRDYRQALQRSPEDPETWRNLAYALAGLGQLAEALSALDRALEQAPGDATAWARRARLLDRLGRSDEALASCRRSAELGGEDPWCAALKRP